MRFKTSCFNPALCRNNLRRFWPLPLTVFVLLTMLMLMPLRGSVLDPAITRASRITGILGQVTWLVVLLPFLAFLSSALVFRHIHTRRDIQFFFGLPLKRSCLYGTAWVTGFFLVAGPLLVVELIELTICGSDLGLDGVLAVLRVLGVGLGSYLLFYALSVLACTLAGQTFGALLIYGGLNFAVMLVCYGAVYVSGTFLPGFSVAVLDLPIVRWLTPVVKLMMAVEAEVSADGEIVHYFDPVAVGVYALAGAVITVLSGILYRFRPAETAGEMVSFAVVRSCCKVFGALAVTSVGILLTVMSGLFSRQSSFSAVLAMVVIFGCIGYLAAEMVVGKTLSVFHRRSLGKTAIYVAVLLVLVTAGKLDVFGRVDYVPAVDEVSSVELTLNYGNGVALSPEDAVALHETILENRDLLVYDAGSYSVRELTLRYETKNGKQLHRVYRLRQNLDTAEDALNQYVKKLLSKPAYCMATWFGGLPNGVTAENLLAVNVYGNTGMLELDREVGYGAYEAVCRDIAAGNLAPSGYDTYSGPGSIDFQCRASLPGKPQKNEVLNTAYIPLNPNMTETLRYLEEQHFSVDLEE